MFEFLKTEPEPEVKFNFEKLVKKRITKKNKNWLSVIVGETGSGKSYCALRLAYDIDPNFSIDNVIFKTQDLAKKIRQKRIKGGSVLVLDEAGVAHPSRRWFSLQNQVFNYILQTFRRENLGLIFTVPDLSFVDIQARKLFHNYLETYKIIYSRNVCQVKLFKIQNNPRLSKIYFHRYRDKVTWGKIALYEIRKPPANLCKEYEKRKKEFTDQLYKRIERIYEAQDKQKQSKRDKIVMEFQKLRQPVNSKLVRKIASKTNSTERYVWRVKKSLPI